MAESDDVHLPDLQVIQRYSLAVRGASAPRAEVIAALTADLEWLRGGVRRRTTTTAAAAPVPATATNASPVKKAPAKQAPVKKGPAKKAPASPKSGARRA